MYAGEHTLVGSRLVAVLLVLALACSVRARSITMVLVWVGGCMNTHSMYVCVYVCLQHRQGEPGGETTPGSIDATGVIR
jgi:hypothetical protein